MRIPTGLVVFFCALVALIVLQTLSLLAQIRGVSAGYDALLAGEVREAQAARVVQVDFRKQLQEWQAILLRGHTPEDLRKYTRKLYDEESQVRSGAAALVTRVADAECRELLDQFLSAHKTLGDSYRAAYQAYVGGGFDFKVADRMVRGQDRAPSELLEQVVARLNDDVATSVAAQQRAVARARSLALTLSGALLAGLGLAGLVAVWCLGSRGERASK